MRGGEAQTFQASKTIDDEFWTRLNVDYALDVVLEICLHCWRGSQDRLRRNLGKFMM